jgi:hypothetical protein
LDTPSRPSVRDEGLRGDVGPGGDATERHAVRHAPGGTTTQASDRCGAVG